MMFHIAIRNISLDMGGVNVSYMGKPKQVESLEIIKMDTRSVSFQDSIKFYGSTRILSIFTLIN
jgi:hypothetical protein